MAKLNKRFKFIKEVSKETYYADIYSSLDDMEDNQPVLKADVVLDESTTIPGYIQGSRSRYDDDLLDVYVAPTNGQAEFRLKSRSVKRIATGVSIFSTPGNHTFNVPIGVTRVLAITVAGGSNFDYIHRPRPTNWSELEKYLQCTSVPSKVSVTGSEDAIIESGVDKQTASYSGSQITGYSIDAVTGHVTKHEIPVNTALYFGTPSGIYNDSTSAYIHSASGQLRAKVIDVRNIESLDIVVGNYGNATDTNNPKVGLTELTSGSLEATTIPRGVNGTIEKFSDTLGKTPHIFKVDAVGMGGLGTAGLSPDTNDPGNQAYDPASVNRSGVGTIVKFTTPDRTINTTTVADGASAQLNNITMNDPTPIPGAKFTGSVETNPNYAGITALTAEQLEAGRGLKGKDVKQIYIEGLEGYDNPILEGGAGGLPGKDGQPGKVCKFYTIKDGVPQYIKSGGGGAGASYITGKIVTINGTDYADGKEVTATASYNKMNDMSTSGSYAISYGGVLEPKVNLAIPNTGLVSIIYGPDIESGDIPTYTWLLDQESYDYKNKRYYSGNVIQGSLSICPKRIFVSHTFIADESATSETFMTEDQKSTLDNLVLEYKNDSGAWVNFKTPSMTFTMMRENGLIYLDIPLRIYSTEWRVRLPDENLHLKTKNGVKIDSYVIYSDEESNNVGR